MESKFSVIRYIADPARNEPINLGVVLQCGEVIDVKTNTEAVRRAITSDPQADSVAMGRIDAFVTSLISQHHRMQDSESGSVREVHPLDQNCLTALAGISTGKLVFAEPQSVEVPSSDKREVDRTLDMLVRRLARPLKQRSVFAPIESAPRQYMRRALRPWIDEGIVSKDAPMESKSGVPRVADFLFQNGRSYVVKHVMLEHKRESQLFAKAQSDAFELEDIRRGGPDKEWQPVVVCQFATDRAEETVSQVKNIFDVVDCATFDASQELDEAVQFVEAHLPTLTFRAG